MMNNIARGFFDGKPDEHLLFVDSAFGFITKALYSITLSVNWYALLYMIIILLCAVSAIRIIGKRINYYIALLVALTLESMCIYWFTFTVLAYTCAVLGVLELISNLKESKSISKYIGNCCFGVLFLAIGFITRSNAFFSSVIMLLPIICVGIKKQINIKRTVAAVLATILIVLAFGMFNSATYDTNLWKEQKEFSVARSNVIDYPVTSYGDDESFYKKIKYSKNDLECATNWCFGDKTVFNTSKYNKIVKNTPFTTRYCVYPKSYVKVIKKYVFALTWLSLILFIALGIAAIVMGKKKWLLIIQGIFILGTVWLTFFVNRPLPRIVVPVLVLGMISIAFIFVEEKENESISIKRFSWGFGIAMAIMLAFFTIKTISNSKYFKVNYQTKQATVTDYVNKHKDALYICQSKTDLLYNTPINDMVGDEECTNLMQAGDQDIYNSAYYNQLKALGVESQYLDRLLMNLVKRDKTYLIVDEEKDSEFIKMVQTYLSEHTGRQIDSHVVEKLKNKISVYKFEE